MLRWFNRIHGLRYASLRYFNVAGAIEGYGEAHEPESHLIPLILDVALGRREKIKIFGQDYPTRTGRASATTSMCATWRTRICWRWRRWRRTTG
jgi:UDP-glucose 4-epimerase